MQFRVSGQGGGGGGVGGRGAGGRGRGAGGLSECVGPSTNFDTEGSGAKPPDDKDAQRT